MARLRLIDLDISDELRKQLLESKTHIPFELFDILTKYICPTSKSNYDAIRFVLGVKQRTHSEGSRLIAEIPISLAEGSSSETCICYKQLLASVQLVLKDPANLLQIDDVRIEAAMNKLQNEAYTWSGVIGQSRSVYDKTFRAEVSVYFGRVAKVQLDIQRDNIQSVTTKLFETEVDNNYWLASIEDNYSIVKWNDANFVHVYRRNKSDYWQFDIDREILQFRCPRAEAGDPHGEYDLGCLYLTGRVVPKDLEMAKLWIKSAADKGYKHAITHLERLG